MKRIEPASPIGVAPMGGATASVKGERKMQREVPTWLAVVLVLVVLAVVVGVYIWRGRPTPQEPQAPFLKGQPAGPTAPPGQRPVMSR